MSAHITPLDQAHVLMETHPEDEGLRLRFFDLLAGAELFVFLSEPADGSDADITPVLHRHEGVEFPFVFDLEERLSDFVQGAQAPYAILSGRRLIAVLAARGLGLGLNLGVAPSETLLDAEAVAWLAERLEDTTPDRVEARAQEILPPKGLPDHLLFAIDAKLAGMGGLAEAAYLCALRYDNGTQGHLLAFIEARAEFQPALAQAMAETLRFSQVEAGALDVGFFVASDPVTAKFAKVGLRFDLPKAAAATGPAAPGRDPDRPPRLR